MKRTQIYLTEKEQQELDRLSNRKGVSKSSIVREAVDEYLAKHSKEHQKRSTGTRGRYMERSR